MPLGIGNANFAKPFTRYETTCSQHLQQNWVEGLALFQTTWSLQHQNLLSFALGYFHQCFVSWSLSHVQYICPPLSSVLGAAANLNWSPGFPPVLDLRDDRLVSVKLTIISLVRYLLQRNCNIIKATSYVCFDQGGWCLVKSMCLQFPLGILWNILRFYLYLPVTHCSQKKVPGVSTLSLVFQLNGQAPGHITT